MTFSMAFFSIYLSITLTHIHTHLELHTHTYRAKRSSVMTQQHHDLDSLTSQWRKFARSAFSDLSIDIKCWTGTRVVCLWWAGYYTGDRHHHDVEKFSCHPTRKTHFVVVNAVRCQFNSTRQRKEGEHISDKNVTKPKCHWRNPELTSCMIPALFLIWYKADNTVGCLQRKSQLEIHNLVHRNVTLLGVLRTIHSSSSFRPLADLR